MGLRQVHIGGLNPVLGALPRGSALRHTGVVASQPLALPFLWGAADMGGEGSLQVSEPV